MSQKTIVVRVCDRCGTQVAEKEEIHGPVEFRIGDTHELVIEDLCTRCIKVCRRLFNVLGLKDVFPANLLNAREVGEEKEEEREEPEGCSSGPVESPPVQEQSKKTRGRPKKTGEAPPQTLPVSEPGTVNDSKPDQDHEPIPDPMPEMGQDEIQF